MYFFLLYTFVVLFFLRNFIMKYLLNERKISIEIIFNCTWISVRYQNKIKRMHKFKNNLHQSFLLILHHNLVRLYNLLNLVFD